MALCLRAHSRQMDPLSVGIALQLRQPEYDTLCYAWGWAEVQVSSLGMPVALAEPQAGRLFCLQ